MREPDENCETCRGTGEVDETLGGHSRADQHAPCPDCVAPVARQIYKMPRPRVCLCHWLGAFGFKCRVHSSITT